MSKKNRLKKLKKEKEIEQFVKKFCNDKTYVNVQGSTFEIVNNNKIRRVA